MKTHGIYMHTMEKKKENPPSATMRMGPEDILLSETSQTEKGICCMISLLDGKCKNAKLIETEYNIMIVARVETFQEKLMAALYHLSHMSEGEKKHTFPFAGKCSTSCQGQPSIKKFPFVIRVGSPPHSRGKLFNTINLNPCLSLR